MESKILNGFVLSENWYCEMCMNVCVVLIFVNFVILFFIIEDVVLSMECDDVSDSKDVFDVLIIAFKVKVLDDFLCVFGGFVLFVYIEYYIFV